MKNFSTSIHSPGRAVRFSLISASVAGYSRHNQTVFWREKLYSATLARAYVTLLETTWLIRKLNYSHNHIGDAHC